jgi:hypothetical protein
MSEQLQKLIKTLIYIIGITFFIMMALGLWFYFKGNREAPPTTPPAEEPAEETPATSNPTPIQPGTPVTPAPTSTPSTGVDAAALYAELLDSIGAKKVDFSRVSSGEIYTFYADDVATAKKLYPDETDFSIGIANIELTGDKIAEVIVYEDLPGFCASGGCPIDVLKKEGEQWFSVFEGLGYDVATTESSTNGYKNLIISMHGTSAGYMTEIGQFVFKGFNYELWNVIAVWGGSSFIPLE